MLRVLSMLLRKNKERLVTYGRLREDKFVFALKRDELDFSYMEKQLERIQQRFGTEDDAPLHIYVGVYPIEDPGKKWSRCAARRNGYLTQKINRIIQ